MATLASLLILMGMDTTGVTAGAAKAEGSLASLGSGALKSLSPVGIAAGAAGVAIGAMAVAGVKAAIDFDAAFTRIGAISNASAKDIESWKGQVLDLAGETAKAPKELADALFFLSSAGLDVKQVMPALEASAKAAASGLGETADVANIVASALNAYSESGLTAASVTDTLVAAVREGRAEPEEFAGALGRILPIASAIGVTFDQVAGSMAVLSNIGLDVNEAVTAMRGVLQAVAAPGTEAAKAMQSLGLSAQDLLDAISEDGIIGALRLLDAAARDQTKTQAAYFGILQDVVPNIRSLTGVLGLTGQAAEKVDAIMQNVAESTGATDEAFRTTAQSSAFQIKQALNEIGIAGQKLAEDLLPVLADTLGLIAKAADVVTAPFEVPVAPGFDPKFIQFQNEYGAAIDHVAELSVRGKLTSDEYSAAIQQIADEFNRSTGAVDIYTHKAIDVITTGLEGRNAMEGQADAAQKLRAGMEAVVPKLDDAADAGARFARRFGEVAKAIRDDLVKEIPGIVGTVTTIKDTFTLSPGELVKIAHSWQEIAHRIARDLREIARADLTPAMREAISALPPEMRDAWVRGNEQQRNAIEGSIKNSYKIQDQIPGLAKQALTGGQQVGHDMAAGMARGIQSGSGAVTAAATTAVNNAVAAARRAAQAESPSKKMAELGQDMIRGLVEGLLRDENTLLAAAEKVMDGLQSKLSNLLSKSSSFGQTIQGGFSSLFDLSGAVEAGTLGISPQDFFQGQVGLAQGFADVLKALAAQGAGKALLADIASQGPAAGIAFGQSLLQQGPAGVTEVNRAYNDIARIAEKTADSLTNRFFGDRIADLRGDVKSQKDVLVDIRQEIRSLEKVLDEEKIDITLVLDGQVLAKFTRKELTKIGNRNAGTGIG